MDTMKVKQELQRGMEAANQLSLLLSSESPGQGGGKEELRACKLHHSAMILKSFNNALFMVRDAHLSRDPSNPTISLLSHNCPRSMQPEMITTKLKEDGHAWRKYGQKTIANAKHPREYYRCGHKDQGCQATKKVQIIAENPTTYKIIYYGQHTCQSYQILGDEFHQLKSVERDPPNIISFGCSIEPVDEPKQVCNAEAPTQQEMKIIQEENQPSNPQDQYVDSYDPDQTAINQPQEVPPHMDVDMDAVPSMLYPPMSSPHLMEEDFNINYLVDDHYDELINGLWDFQN